MNKTSLTSLVVALALPLSAMADTRYFFDGVFGKADQKNSVSQFDTITATDTATGIRTGFYLNNAFGIELVSMDYGRAEDGFINNFGDSVFNTMETEWLGAGLHGNIKIGHKTRLTGRVGLAAWQLKFTETDSGFPGDRFFDKDEGVDAYVGLGIRFDIEDNIRVALEYENLDFSAVIGAAETDHSVNSIGVSIGVLF